MSSLVLSDSLLKEYLYYSFGETFDKKIVRNLLKYIHPFIASENQHSFLKDPASQPQIAGDPLINLNNDKTKSQLINISTLKLILVDKYDAMAKYKEVNISSKDEKMDMLMSATHKNKSEKENAQSHIKSLLQNETHITIIDRYLAKGDNQWGTNKKLLLFVLPKDYKTLTIISEKLTDIVKKDLKNTFKESCSQVIDKFTHDRYIKVDNFTILLSSGLYNLNSNSNKDFTYIVKFNKK